MKKFYLVLITLSALAGCSTSYTEERPDAYYDRARAAGVVSGGTESLFTSDEAILGAEDIQKILAFRYSPPRSTGSASSRSAGTSGSVIPRN